MSEIYIVHVDDYVGAYKGGRCPLIGYAPRNEWVGFIKDLKKSYPEKKIRGIHDEKIEEIVRQNIKYNELLTSELKRVQYSRC